MTRRFTLILVATALAVTVLPGTAGAAERLPAPAAPAYPAETEFDRAVRLLDPYVSRASDGTVSIDAPESVRAAIDPALLARLELSAAMSSALWQPGADPTGAGMEGLDRSSCRGRSGWRTYWWGWRLYMNSCQTDRLVALLEIGAGASSIYCLVLGLAGVACAAFAGALTVLGQSIGYIGGARYGISISSCWPCFLPVIRRQ